MCPHGNFSGVNMRWILVLSDILLTSLFAPFWPMPFIYMAIVTFPQDFIQYILLIGSVTLVGNVAAPPDAKNTAQKQWSVYAAGFAMILSPTTNFPAELGLGFALQFYRFILGTGPNRHHTHPSLSSSRISWSIPSCGP